MEDKEVKKNNSNSMNTEDNSDVNQKVKSKSLLSKYKLDIIFIASVIIITYVLSNNYSLLFIQGESMYPTYSDKEILILKKEDKFSHGDIVVFNSPDSWSKENKKFIKRIIATEGDMITIGNDKLLVNGVFVDDISEKKCGLKEDINVGVDSGEFFLVGDNYSASNDSLTQFCNKNESFLVDKELLILSGKELLVIGGSK